MVVFSLTELPCICPDRSKRFATGSRALAAKYGRRTTRWSEPGRSARSKSNFNQHQHAIPYRPVQGFDLHSRYHVLRDGQDQRLRAHARAADAR
jgi:hypothetical protein